MKHETRYREVLPDARRIVVKIGSRVIVQKTGRPDAPRLRRLVSQILALRKRGYDVLVVTSGAIGAGMEALGLKERPQAVSDLQMCAAVGQTRLMARYAELFGRERVRIGQVLLTHADFQHKIRLTNAKRTLERLLRAGVIPLINENDVVADEEIRADLALGDNDYLAALLVKLVRADLLILLSTVDGLRAPGTNGRTRRVRVLESITPKTFSLVTPGDSPISKGGMSSKLRAAQIAVRAGCNVVIADGRSDHVLCRVVDGIDTGTLILASGT